MKKGFPRGLAVSLCATAVLFCGCGPTIHQGWSITSDPPPDAAITFDVTDDLVVAPGDTLMVRIDETFDSYAWTLDGAILPGQTAATATIPCTPLFPGSHHVSAFVERGGLLFSRDLRFFVAN